MKFRTWKPSTTPIYSFFPKKQRYFTTSLFTEWTQLKAMMWFENWYLRCLPYQFLLWKQRTRQVKVSRILLAVFISLILPYIVLSCLSLPHLVLPHMILSFRASLQSHHGPCVWPLSEKNWLTASSKKIDIKNYKMYPWQRWLGGFVDCHAGWLTSLRNGNRFILTILIILKTDPFSWPPSAMVWLRINLNVKGCCSIILKCSPTCKSLNMKKGEIREAQRGNKEANFEEARAS